MVSFHSHLLSLKKDFTSRDCQARDLCVISLSVLSYWKGGYLKNKLEKMFIICLYNGENKVLP